MTKLITEIPPISDKDCYYLQERNKPCFNYPIHKHNVYELNFVEHCAGARRIVGDSMEILGDYELAFVGCNLEHVWEQFECKSESIHEITIMIPPDLISEKFLERRAMQPLKDMFQKSKHGIAFGMKAIIKVYDKIMEMANSEPSMTSVRLLLDVLYDLSLSDDYHTLASAHYSHAESYTSDDRIQRVTDYIDQHYRGEIRIETLSNIVGMTPNSLSRFFKQRTNRSISDYINEARISHSVKLLVESNKTVIEISYDSGFNSISNFNRIFKMKKGMTPKEFREIYVKNVYLV